MVLGGSPLGASALGASRKVSNAIVATDLLPSDAKRIIIDYINDTFNKLWSTIEDLLVLEPPTFLIDWWDIVIEILITLGG